MGGNRDKEKTPPSNKPKQDDNKNPQGAYE